MNEPVSTAAEFAVRADHHSRMFCRPDRQRVIGRGS
jgi:hypothetical protein